MPIAFTEDWDETKLMATARDIVAELGSRIIGYAAFDGDSGAGYITIGTGFLGSQKQYVQLVEFVL